MKRINFGVCLKLVVFAGLVSAPGSRAEDKGGEPATVYDWDSVLNAYIPREICKESDKCECGGGGDSGGGGQSATADPALKCVQMDIGMGAPRYSALSGAIILQLNELQASSRLYSPDGFHVVAGYTVHRVSRQTNAGGVPKWVQVSTPSGVVTEYVFADGESVGVPVSGREDVSSGRLAMVDAQGWATAADPAFYDYYPGDGARWCFGAARGAPDYLGLIEHQTPQGRVETKQDVGLEVIRDANGALRQVATPARLADFVITGQDAYDLTVYPNDASCVTGARTAEGNYQIAAGAVPEVVWKFRNPTPGTYGVLEVTREMPGAGARTWRYEYVEAVQDFVLRHPGGIKEERVERIENDDKTSRTVRRTELGPDGVAYSKKELRYETRGGSLELVASVNDPGGLNLTTAYDYYSEGASVGLERMSVSPDGSWIRYEYDGQKRKTAVATPWLDSPTNAPDNQCAVTRYGYGLFAAGDFLAYNDQRPRTEIKEICGVEGSRTYHAYPTNALGQAQEIEERAAFPGAPYGHVSNPRTVKTFYAASASLPLPGRLATVVYPGGKTETYAYEYGIFNAASFAFTPDHDGGAWRETVTTSYGANSGVQSVREARVWDEKGREVLNESYVEDGGSFARIGWTRMSYDRNGKLIETAFSDGRVEGATWGSNCCGKESETSAEGVITVYGYNELKQKVSETKKGLAADGADDIVTLFTYDLGNRVLSTAVTNVASGLGYVVSRNAYDAVGRMTNAVDRLGNPTITTYDTLATSAHRPNSVTAVTERYLDGKAKRVLENGIVKQSYAYGVSPDGTRWALSAEGPLSAEIQPTLELPNFRTLALLNFPWQLHATDPLVRTITTYKPGFGGTVLVTSNTFDIVGNLLSSSQYATEPNSDKQALVSRNLYLYSANGFRNVTALDFNTNGVIDFEGPDRITGSSSFYEKNTSNIWWQVSRSWVYSEFNSSSAVTTSVQRVQLTGLGVQQGDDGVLIFLSEAFDGRGNVMTSKVLVDRANCKLAQVLVLPTSEQPIYKSKINGLPQKTVSSTAVTNTFGYDALGRRITATDGRGNTVITAFNPQGLVAYTEDAATNRTSNVYDALGRRTESTDALGNTTHMRYDAEGRVTQTWGPAIYPVEYGYDAQGRMVLMKTFRDENGEGDETRWLYDQPTGVLTNKSYADGLGPAYTYTPDGKLATRTWARLNSDTGDKLLTRYSYDVAGSILCVDYSDATPDVTYTFDRLGNQLSAASSVSTNLFAYSPQTLDPVSETQNGVRVTRPLDDFGRSTGLDVGDAYVVSYGYDNLGRFSSVSSSVCSVSSVVNYSRLLGTDLITGYKVLSPVSNFQVQVSKAYALNRDFITQVRNETPVGIISQYDYIGDAVGRRVSRQDSGLAFVQSQFNTFGYNQRSEVTSAVMSTNTYGYLYDPIGNRLIAFINSATNTYSANNLNQYISVSAADAPLREPKYDADGNMTSTGDGWHYVWNAENRLVLASNVMFVARYAYDWRGRMVWKTVSSSNAAAEKAIAYIWDDCNIIAEHITTNDAMEITYNVWGLDLSGTLHGAGGIGGFLSTYKGGAIFLPACDANGNVTEYISSNGTIVAHREYSPFGGTIIVSDPAVGVFTHWWSTKPLCEITGLSEYEHRMYKYSMGRWINRDMITEEAFAQFLVRQTMRKSTVRLSFDVDNNHNLYSLLKNNSLMSVDPIGLVKYKAVGCSIDYVIRGNTCMWDCSCPGGWHPSVAKRTAPCDDPQVQMCWRLEPSDYAIGACCVLLAAADLGLPFGDYVAGLIGAGRFCPILKAL